MAFKNHPERKPGEVYMGNAQSIVDFAHKTVRHGDVALDVHGGRVPASYGYRPVFVSAKEHLERLERLVEEYAFDPTMSASFAEDAADLRAFVKEQDGIDL